MLVLTAVMISLITTLTLALTLRLPRRQLARAARISATKTLFSVSQDDKPENLHRIEARLGAPLRKGGSLEILKLYLSKDPGRRDFVRFSDRNRFREYLDETDHEMIKTYMTQFDGMETPNWIPEYAATIRVLFDAVKRDLLILSGVPAELTPMSIPSSNSPSITENVQLALENFANTWVPRGGMSLSNAPNRQRVRSFLLENWRFRLRLRALDKCWKRLLASLYNLSVDANWILAAKHHPSIQIELDELTMLVLSADIYRRDVDLLARIPAVSGTPGINWVPNFSYYKNIPELSGYTSDAELTIFTVRVNIGYTFRDGGTQTWLNRRKDWLTDYFNSFFSGIKSSDFNPTGSLFGWRVARLKAAIIHHINGKIVSESTFGSKGIYGVRDLALLEVNLLVDPD